MLEQNIINHRHMRSSFSASFNRPLFAFDTIFRQSVMEEQRNCPLPCSPVAVIVAGLGIRGRVEIKYFKCILFLAAFPVVFSRISRLVQKLTNIMEQSNRVDRLECHRLSNLIRAVDWKFIKIFDVVAQGFHYHPSQ